MRKQILYLTIFILVLFVNVVCAEDPDYGDVAENAEPIEANGSMVQGVLDTSSDVDWFVFTPSANTLYRITLSGELNMGHKYIDIYQIDEFGTLHKTIHSYVYSNGVMQKSFFLEEGEDVYVKMYYTAGGYSFYIEDLGQFLPDGYADDCSSASSIGVGTGAIDATLIHNPDGSLETDWFVFNTEPLHTYQINLTKCDNTDLNFQVYNENCECVLDWQKSRTVTSWFGEQYKLFVAGNQDYLGTYYTLEVIDLGVQTDDYSSIAETAEPIFANGSMINGEIEFASSYNSDEDWFVFTPDANTLYQITMGGELNMGHKYMEIFQIDEFGNLHRTLQHYCYSDGTSVKTFFLEEGNDVYLRVYYTMGNYSFYIESLGQFLPDGSSDDCENPTNIVVDAAAIDGTLTHYQDGSLETDWFVFDTQPLHMYQINLTKSDNTDLNFQVYNEDCECVLDWQKSRTVTSWFGEQYKLFVAGNQIYLGTYYTIEVIDLGLQVDDYANTKDGAEEIAKDGSLVSGEIQFLSNYHSDEDWFTFISGREGDYQFMMTGEVDKGHKYINVYWEDEFGVLHNQKNTYVYSNNVNNFTVNMPAGRIYLQMYYTLGGYSLSVESPEPRCGDLDHPYPPGDTNQDCHVNLLDIAVVAENWLRSTDPNSE